MKKCEVCDITIPEGRLKVIPFTTTCVNCSTEEKWSGGHVIHHKTGNEVCVIKDINVAKEFHKMSMRAGFGTMRGMKPGVSGGTKSKGLTVSVAFQADTVTFEEMGTKAMDMYELYGIDKLNRFLSEKVTERVISFGQSQKILKLISVINTKEISQKNIKNYNPYGKYEPNISKGLVSKEIEESFKYWRK